VRIAHEHSLCQRWEQDPPGRQTKPPKRVERRADGEGHPPDREHTVRKPRERDKSQDGGRRAGEVVRHVRSACRPRMLGGVGCPGIAPGNPGLRCVQVDAGIEPENVEVVWEALEVGSDSLPGPVGKPRSQP
jgi:hypothetical protein